MQTRNCRSLQRNKALILPAVLLLLLAALAMAPPLGAFADAGGWPTATPTNTLAPSLTPTVPVSEFAPTPEATSSLLFFPPTPTFTPVVPVFAEGQAIPQVQAATPPPTEPGFSFLSCWPFALIVLLTAIVGIYFLRNRIRGGVP